MPLYSPFFEIVPILATALSFPFSAALTYKASCTKHQAQGTNIVGYWKHNGKTIVKKGTLKDPTTEEEYDLPGGQGLWCFVGKGSSGSPIVIKFPALELK